MPDTNCIYCNNHRYYFLHSVKDIDKENYSIVQCENCHCIYLAPKPNSEQLARAYSDEYYGENESKFSFSFVEKTLDIFRLSRAKKLKKYLQKKESKILDIGCGNGNFLNNVNKIFNSEIYGIELEGNSYKRASKIPEINLFKGRLIETDFENDLFDVITMFHVFEHIENPKQHLQKIKDVLKKDGHLIMSFPNIDSWQYKTYKQNWLHLDPPRHLFYFEHRQLIKIMSKHGFSMEKKTTFSLEQNPYGGLQSFLNIFNKNRDFLYEKLKGSTKLHNKNTTFVFNMVAAVLLSPFFVFSDIFSSLCGKGATVKYIFKLTEEDEK